MIGLLVISIKSEQLVWTRKGIYISHDVIKLNFLSQLLKKRNQNDFVGRFYKLGTKLVIFNPEKTKLARVDTSSNHKVSCSVTCYREKEDKYSLWLLSERFDPRGSWNYTTWSTYVTLSLSLMAPISHLQTHVLFFEINVFWM